MIETRKEGDQLALFVDGHPIMMDGKHVEVSEEVAFVIKWTQPGSRISYLHSGLTQVVEVLIELATIEAADDGDCALWLSGSKLRGGVKPGEWWSTFMPLRRIKVSRRREGVYTAPYAVQYQLLSAPESEWPITARKDSRWYQFWLWPIWQGHWRTPE